MITWETRLFERTKTLSLGALPGFIAALLVAYVVVINHRSGS